MLVSEFFAKLRTSVRGEAVIMMDADLQHPPEFPPVLAGNGEKEVRSLARPPVPGSSRKRCRRRSTG